MTLKITPRSRQVLEHMAENNGRLIAPARHFGLHPGQFRLLLQGLYERELIDVNYEAPEYLVLTDAGRVVVSRRDHEENV